MGGLYPDGRNDPPLSHKRAIFEAARSIKPLGPDGLIGLVDFGYSNPTHEFGAFAYQEYRNLDRNASIVIVAGSQGGQDISKVIDVDENNSNEYWRNVADKVATAGLTPDQVQVAWVKFTLKGESTDFLEAQAEFVNELIAFMKILKVNYPNVRIAYISSRIFGAYAQNSAEPQDYEEGFGVKFLIEDQIEGTNPDLDFRNGTVPLILWGPYIWANGDWQPYGNLIWCLEDFEFDGLNKHPNEFGEQKVADALSTFFATDRSTRSWWVRQAGRHQVTFEALRDTYVQDDSQNGCTQVDIGNEPFMYIRKSPVEQRQAFVTFDVSGETRPVIRAYLGLRVHPLKTLQNGETLSAKGGTIRLVSEDADDWVESSFTWCSQPPVDTLSIHYPNGYSRSSYLNVDVTAAYRADTDGILSFRLESDTLRSAGYMTRDPALDLTYLFPPILTLIVEDSTASSSRPVPAAPSPQPDLKVYPEPFNPRTTVRFTLSGSQPVDLSVFDLTGRRVARLASGMLPAGKHRYTFDGSRLASGVYLVRLLTPVRRVTRRITLLK